MKLKINDKSYDLDKLIQIPDFSKFESKKDTFQIMIKMPICKITNLNLLIEKIKNMITNPSGCLELYLDAEMVYKKGTFVLQPATPGTPSTPSKPEVTTYKHTLYLKYKNQLTEIGSVLGINSGIFFDNEQNNSTGMINGKIYNFEGFIPMSELFS